MRREIDSPTTQMGGWQSHYNEKTRRCYALIDQYNTGGPGVRSDMPYLRFTLWDAMERRQVAHFTQEPNYDEPRGIWCQQTTEDEKREVTGPLCKDVAAYVSKLMSE